MGVLGLSLRQPTWFGDRSWKEGGVGGWGGGGLMDDAGFCFVFLQTVMSRKFEESANHGSQSRTGDATRPGKTHKNAGLY
jgi:hypothetical protein